MTSKIGYEAARRIVNMTRTARDLMMSETGHSPGHVIYRLTAEQEIISGKAVHYYFAADRPMVDWLIRDVEKDFDIGLFDLVKIWAVVRLAVLHFRTSCNVPSMAFGFGRVRENGKRAFILMPSREADWNYACNFDDSAMIEFKTIPEPARSNVQLACGLAVFCQVFPECVTDGIPEDVKHPSHHHLKNTKTICAPPQVLGGTHASPVGHLRHAHKRKLKAARFLFQREIQIPACHVNGGAKTIDPELCQQTS